MLDEEIFKRHLAKKLLHKLIERIGQKQTEMTFPNGLWAICL